MDRAARKEKLAALCLANAAALREALAYCTAHGIGDFRVNSRILPLRTHPEMGYAVEELPEAARIVAAFKACGRFAQRHGLRTTFHPDPFVVLNSPDAAVAASAVAELTYQAEVAGWLGADVINVHGGGGYGDKTRALQRLCRRIGQLPRAVRKRLTLENDDRVYRPADLLPVCRATGVPLVYDVHHHRCLPDGRGVEQTTELALQTWDREPLFHVSSPLAGWRGAQPRRHHAYIRARDFPACWLGLAVTVEVEAKAKELALARLGRYLESRVNAAP